MLSFFKRGGDRVRNSLATRNSSLLDRVFGSAVDDLSRLREADPFQGWFSMTTYGPQTISEKVTQDEYVAQVTVPDGFNLDDIRAEVSGNILTVTVPRTQQEVKTVPVAKATDEGE